MAYINVAEWTPDQVTDWLKGLDDCMYNYVYSFTNNEVGGQQLLNIRPYELEQLGMHSIGHQEILLEAMENLRNFHYNLDKENLQFMALHVATAARSLHRQLAAHCDTSKVETQILNDITHTIGTIKPLISWLDRSPFHGQVPFTDISRTMLRLGLEMATIAQRDRFVEGPAEQIRATAEKLERLANFIIQDITDPMLLQPASLNLVTLKKRESELGFNIEPSYHGIHRVTDIKYNSPAHNSGKIEDGDEIVQINYQTVVGWRYKTVLLHLRESLPDVLLTLKKRPKHTKIYGQIYMQPYRLPSKKRTINTRWGENSPSPRTGLLTVPLKTEEKINTDVAASSDTDSSCSDILTPTGAKSAEKEIRLYYPKPRAMLQRRNTICIGELLGLKCVGGVSMWDERKAGGAICDPSSPSLRDKSISFGFGLEIAPRPTTCIGISSDKFNNNNNTTKNIFSDEKKLEQVPESALEYNEPSESINEKSKPGISKVVRFDANMKYENYTRNEKYTCNVENTILETFEPIPFVDEEEDSSSNSFCNSTEKSIDILSELNKASKCDSVPLTEAVNLPIIARRGRLDKSHSTPAYDNNVEESDTPPAIEPRKEFLLVIPPIPPPRPQKQKGLSPAASSSPVPPPKPPPSLVVESSVSDAKVVVIPNIIHTCVQEKGELHTPNRTKTLTLKKKHSLIAKRRNINLKLLGIGDIQGHLYRRRKDRRGVTFWARLYFVMLDTILYGFRSKEALKASCIVFLPGFTVSFAKEVHSRPFAFKVYHSSKTFYFAAESEDSLHQWVEFIRSATTDSHSISSMLHDTKFDATTNTKELFSETESSGEEAENVSANLGTPSPQNMKENRSTSSTSSAKSTSNTPTTTKTDRRYLGSLRKLTKGTLPFKTSSSNEKKNSSDIPVPTDQYRSYRKVPGGSFGIQIGTNTGYHPYNVNTHNNNVTTFETPSEEHQRKHPLTSSRISLASNGEAAIVNFAARSSPTSATTTTASISTYNIQPRKICQQINKNQELSFESLKIKSIKKVPYNFIHASNPNLVEFDFQTSKTLDYSLPKINPSNSWDAHHNIQGFVTLKDLMLQKQEEEAQEMYNNRVLLGIERKHEYKHNAHKRIEYKLKDNANHHEKNIVGVGGKLSKTQNRSLPKTPDYEISFKPDDEDIRYTRTKEGLKLRDFGYELISGDEPLGGNTSNAARSRYLLKPEQSLIYSLKNRKHSNNGSIISTSESGVNSFEKHMNSFKKKGKLETVKTSSERIFQFNRSALGSSSRMVMTLPNKKSNNAMDKVEITGLSIQKSHTYNNDLKEKAEAGKYEARRKNSAPIPIFSKLPFTSNSSSSSAASLFSQKEKRMLGSPLSTRSIASNQTAAATCSHYDGEIFSQVIFPKVPIRGQQENTSKFRKLSTASNSSIITAPDVDAPPPPIAAQSPTTLSPSDANKSIHSKSNMAAAASLEYPNLECPPVFEPEIYSLTDPNASLTLMLRSRNSGKCNNDITESDENT